MLQMTVLVIDKDYIFNSLAKLVLEHDTDWRILTASDGKEGVALARLYQPNIILLDISMPNINRLDVYYLLKVNPTTNSIPIIFLTSILEVEKIINRQVIVNIKVMRKPFDMKNLACQITEACDRYSIINN